MKNLFVCAVVIALLGVATVPASAAERLSQPELPSAPIGPFLLPADAPSDIILEGTIEDDAPSQFLRALRARPGATRLVLSSDGGKVDPALIIAREVHSRGLSTVIPADAGCYSACAFVFLAGTDRSIERGGSLGVHQIYGSSDPAAVQIVFSDVFDALRSFGVSDGVVLQMLRTPPDGMHVFSRDELASLGIVLAPTIQPLPIEPTNHKAPLKLGVPGTHVSEALLLEASDTGTTGALPFSGTVEWSRGTDGTGLPTLVGKATIPDRNLGVDVLIRKNSDPRMPASHLMEVNFRVNDSFIGGSVAGLPGVLLKNEELVLGTPLVGASARVVGDSFLFAFSDAPEDLSANLALLSSRKWIDLALIYDTGKRAIMTLEKGPQASTLFQQVIGEWGVEDEGGHSRASKSSVAPEQVERVVMMHEEGRFKDTLLKNGFDEQTYDMASATLSNVLSTRIVPAGTWLRIRMGMSRISEMPVPLRLSMYFPDPRTGGAGHVATIALTDRGQFVLALQPEALRLPDGTTLGQAGNRVFISGDSGKVNRYRPH